MAKTEDIPQFLPNADETDFLSLRFHSHAKNIQK
jgi:hypothetical protein